MRDSFVFYRSFHEALNNLNNRDRLLVYDAIAGYALDMTDPKLSGIPFAIFTLIKPQLDANNKRYQNGKKGGRPRDKAETETKPKDNQRFLDSAKTDKPKDKQTETEAEPNVNVNVNVNVNENGECSIPPTPQGEPNPLSRFDGELRKAVEGWLAYKDEKRQAYKPTGLKALLTEIRNNADKYGDDAVAEVIRQSMGSNYQGITFDRLKRGGKPLGSSNSSNPRQEAAGDWGITTLEL